MKGTRVGVSKRKRPFKWLRLKSQQELNGQVGLNVEIFILYHIKNNNHVTFIYHIVYHFFNRDGPIVLAS